MVAASTASHENFSEVKVRESFLVESPPVAVEEADVLSISVSDGMADSDIPKWGPKYALAAT